MDCDYILTFGREYGDGDDESGGGSFPFHAPTPEEAVRIANEIIAQKQGELTGAYSSSIVNGILYRGFLEISGRDFIKITHKTG